MKVTITWMNGQKKTYRCKSWCTTDNGKLLWLQPEQNVITGGSQEPTRLIPLGNQIMEVEIGA